MTEIIELRDLDEEIAKMGVRLSITTSNDPHRNSVGEEYMGQPISSLQRAIRNTIIGGVRTAASRQSDSDPGSDPAAKLAGSDDGAAKTDKAEQRGADEETKSGKDDTFFKGWEGVDKQKAGKMLVVGQ